jgi:ABC-type microcin C transport system permease subunit YejE
MYGWEPRRAIDYIAEASANGVQQARALLAHVKPGALVLADLGYFG